MEALEEGGREEGREGGRERKEGGVGREGGREKGKTVSRMDFHSYTSLPSSFPFSLSFSLSPSPQCPTNLPLMSGGGR